MIYRVYSIFDRKALIYHPPFFQPTDGAATRLVRDLANDVQTQIGRHPGDYVLYRVGTYDDSNGGLYPIDPRDHVVDVIALVDRPADLFPPLLKEKV